MAAINDPTKFSIKFANTVARENVASINIQALKNLVALQQLCDCKITIKDGAVDAAALQAAAKALGVSVSELTTRKGFTSMHYKGEAIDVTIENPTEANRVAFAKAAATVGFTGIGVYNNPGLFHVDIGPTRAWGPNLHSSSLPGNIANAIAAGRAAAPGYAANHPNGPTIGGSVATGPRNTAGGEVQAGVGAITGGIKSGSLSGPAGGGYTGSTARGTPTGNVPGNPNAPGYQGNTSGTPAAHTTGGTPTPSTPSQESIQNAIDSRAGYGPTTPAGSVTTGSSVRSNTPTGNVPGNPNAPGYQGNISGTPTTNTGGTNVASTPSQSDIQHAIDSRAGYGPTTGTSVAAGGSVRTGTSNAYAGNVPSNVNAPGYQGGGVPATTGGITGGTSNTPAPTGGYTGAPTPTGGVTGGTSNTPSAPSVPTSPRSERDTTISFNNGGTPPQSSTGGGNGAGIGPQRPPPPAYLLSQEGEGAGEQSDADTPPPPNIGPLCQWFGIACPTVQVTTRTTGGGALQGVNSNIPLTEI
jgi:hypothetical protein